MKAKLLGKYSSNDIELCHTTHFVARKEAVDVLIEKQIPFSTRRRKIPFFRRERYHGATEIYVISIHPQQYSKARRALDQMDNFYRTRLVLSNY